MVEDPLQTADATQAGFPPPGARGPRPATPTQIGRYIVTRPLGHGGMAVVYAAYDPELDRRVAIKVLRGGIKGHRASIGQARLQREAQTLAKLSHPNVVQVYEVGRLDDGVFIAMELIAGMTLRTWLSRQPRGGWREVVRVFAAAGEGLAAAHAVGIIHRDFKPDNVLVGDDGRVRVLDFGLARQGAPDEAPTDPLLAAMYEVEVMATDANAVVGTPAYMAPEQHMGAPVDARCDQFSFCVALYEALYGARPFSGATLPELRLAVVAGHPREPPAGTRVPGWVQRVVARGLRHRPEDRFADMRALLAALADDPAVKRRRWAAVGLAALALGGGAGLYARALALQQARCDGAEANLVGVWDAPRRQAVEQALLATGAAFAPATWAAVERGLDAYATQWVGQTEAACAATHLRGEASAELLDLRHACLDSRLVELRALTGVLARADLRAAEKAVAAVDALPALAPCADERYVRARVKPPTDPQLALAVAAVRAQIAQARANNNAGDSAGSRRLAEAAVPAALALDYPPVQAEAWHQRGMSRYDHAAYADAIVDLGESFHRASQVGDDDLGFQSAVDLARTYNRQSRFAEAWGWTRHAEDALARTGGAPGSKARLLRVQAQIRLGEGELALAEPLFVAALASITGQRGPEHRDTARAENDLGLCLYHLGRHAEAEVHLQRAVEVHRRVSGPEHPEYADSLNSLAAVLLSQDRGAEAQALYEQVLAIVARAYGEDHPDVARALNNLGFLMLERRDLAGAAERFQRALAVLERAHGADDPQLVVPLTNLGLVAAEHGDHAAAIGHYARARAIVEARLGREHPEMLGVAKGLGALYRDLGRLAEAEPLLLLSLQIVERTRDAGDPDVAGARRELELLRALQARALARPGQ